jgi:hypothetical protein
MVSLTRLILRQIVLGRLGGIVTTRARRGSTIPADDHGTCRLFPPEPRSLPGLIIHVHCTEQQNQCADAESGPLLGYRMRHGMGK